MGNTLSENGGPPQDSRRRPPAKEAARRPSQAQQFVDELLFADADSEILDYWTLQPATAVALKLGPLVGAVNKDGEYFDSTINLPGCAPERLRLVEIHVWTTSWQDTRPRVYVNGLHCIYEYDGGAVKRSVKYGKGKSGIIPDRHVIRLNTDEHVSRISGAVGEHGICGIDFRIDHGVTSRRRSVNIGDLNDGHMAETKSAKSVPTFDAASGENEHTVGLHGTHAVFLTGIGLITHEAMPVERGRSGRK